jgi:hypothetical protein
MERARHQGPNPGDFQSTVWVNGKVDRSLSGKSGFEIAEILKERRANQKPGARVRAKIEAGLRQRGIK